jgi:hypothetical protein
MAPRTQAVNSAEVAKVVVTHIIGDPAADKVGEVQLAARLPDVDTRACESAV